MDNGSFVAAFLWLPLGLAILALAAGVLLGGALVVNMLVGNLIAGVGQRMRNRRAQHDEEPAPDDTGTGSH